MKVSELWLREWVDPSINTNQLVEQLTMAGLEVDSLEQAAPNFSDVKVGRVVSTTKHPDAEKLTLCKVDVGQDEQLDIVCGAKNVRENLKVAVAIVGAKLPGDFKIKKAKLRGQISLGMLCSESELGLADSSEGIMELLDDAPIGSCLRDYLDLNDHVMEIDFTPNRGDCLSIRGLAREVAALNNISWTDHELAEIKSTTSVDSVNVAIEEPKHCASYFGRRVEGIDGNAIVPVWLKERLRRSGLRSLSLVVDITNYVMMEYGQPMHAFDADKVKGNIIVRLAKNGEQITLLDGQELTLRDDTLVIADEVSVLALAGVMGGLDSSVTPETKNIIFESAYFAPAKMAGIARSYGLATDSSYRFERGVAPELQQMAIEKASTLLQQIAGGEFGEVSVNRIEDQLPAARQVLLKLDNVNRLLGTELLLADVQDFLKRLGMISEVTEATQLLVTIPSYRFDISIEADLIEEVARVYGYNEIPSAAITADFCAHKYSEQVLDSDTLRHKLVGLGYNEAINYSFVDPSIQAMIYGTEEKSIDLLNPLSKELSQMRQGLWVGLLNALNFNQSRQVSSQKLFEIGLCFEQEGDKINQTNRIAGIISGKYGEHDWSKKERLFDFFDLKGDVEVLFGDCAQQLSFQPITHPALHPGKSAAIYLNDQYCGTLGELHPRLLKSLSLNQPPLLFELEVELLVKRNLTRYQALSKFPSISRDLSLVVDESLPFVKIAEAIQGIQHEVPLQSLSLFDVYQGQNIEKGKKSIAIGLTLQHSCRTLVDSEVNNFMSAILLELEEKFNITLRE